MGLIGFICESGHGYINVESHGQKICPHCKPRKDISGNMPYISVFKSYRDMGTGREITSARQERDICDRENKVLGGYEELKQEAKKYKAENQNKITEQIIDKTINEAVSRGLLE